MVCSFLGGTIVAVESGYKVFPHLKPDKVYNRLSDPKWFLAITWCDNLSIPAGMIDNTGELSFFNQIVLEMGEENFISQQYRLDIFTQCLSLQPNEAIFYELSYGDRQKLEIQALEIDARYGKVALARQIS